MHLSHSRLSILDLFWNIFRVSVVSLNIGYVVSCWRNSAVVLIRERVSMNCSVNRSDEATWTYTAWNTSTETNIYSGRDIVASMRSRYKIDRRISGEHNLIIESVDLFHAGRYKCTAIMERQLKMDVLVAVLGNYKLIIIIAMVLEEFLTSRWSVGPWTWKILEVLVHHHGPFDAIQYGSRRPYWKNIFFVSHTVFKRNTSNVTGFGM